MKKRKIDESAKYTGLFSFLSFKKIPIWLKSFIISLLFFVLIGYFYDSIERNHSLFIYNIIYIRWFLYFGIFTSSIMILYYILYLYLYIMFSKGKINLPIYLPLFILNWLESIKNLSQIPNKGHMISLFLTFLLTYLFILLFTLAILFLL